MPIAISWPFAKWRIDVLGPFLIAPTYKFLLVIIDYFMKWEEVEVLVCIIESS